jgi:beta-glucosidase
MSPPGGFPRGFLWGAATSAYQVEGSPLADGAGPSNWHRFAHTPGRTRDGDTGDVACDHYRRFAEDVRLMADLGLNAYRFSLAWSRLLPEGRGRVNPAGIDHYSRVVDTLLAHDIQPLVTLFHWDHPSALDDHGGWLDPDMPLAFADYAKIAFEALDDRVTRWATLNEPWVVMDAGYLHGVHAPGHRSPAEAPVVAHHLLLAHAAAVDVYRAIGRHEIGLVVNLEPKYAHSSEPEDQDATRRADAYMNRQFLDPVFLGRWPDELREAYGDAWPFGEDHDLSAVRRPLDFLGVNYYTRGVMRDDPEGLPPRATRERQPGKTYTETGWEVFPEGLTRTLVWVKERYGGIPLHVTENGSAFADPPRADAEPLEDPARVEYLEAHVRAAAEAIERGVDLRGYFAWSLLDNFEWSEGYSKRFGLVHVDFETQRRTLKRSALVYRDLIRSRSEVHA